jgi:hypothetical protein
MVNGRSVVAWLALAALAAGSAWAGEEMAEVVPRADDISMNLTIENIDGKIVNVPEAHIRQISPGDHYLGIKIELGSASGGALITGLGTFSAISGAVNEKPPMHEGVSFTALPGRRYLVNGAMVDGKPKIWVEEESFESNPDDDRK